MPYSLDSAGRPDKADADPRRARREAHLLQGPRRARQPVVHAARRVPAAPQVDHEKTDIFRREINRSQELKEKLHSAKAGDVAALDALRDDLGDIAAREAGVVIDLFLAYRAVKAWDKMIALYKAMDPVLANTALAREQYAFALNRAGTRMCSRPGACSRSSSPSAARRARPTACSDASIRIAGAKPGPKATHSRRAATSRRRSAPIAKGSRRTGATRFPASTP